MTAVAFTSLLSEQIKVYQDASQVAQAYGEAARAEESAGWMTWKAARGREYLFHGFGRAGNGTSQGVRDTNTEQRMAQFQADKQALSERRTQLGAQVTHQAKYVKVERLNRLPQIAGRVLNLLAKAGLAERLKVIGTNALYVYEALAAVRFDEGITATRDLDLLWDARGGIVFTGDFDEVELRGFSAILKKADKTFTVSEERTFCVTNADGYAVDFLMQRILNEAPSITRTVFTQDGYPCAMRVVDPRYFALHKWWVAARTQSAKDQRDPGKARRDQLQAIAVCDLIAAHLPMYSFDEQPFLSELPRALKPYLKQAQARARKENQNVEDIEIAGL